MEPDEIRWDEWERRWIVEIGILEDVVCVCVVCVEIVEDSELISSALLWDMVRFIAISH